MVNETRQKVIVRQPTCIIFILNVADAGFKNLQVEILVRQVKTQCTARTYIITVMAAGMQ